MFYTSTRRVANVSVLNVLRRGAFRRSSLRNLRSHQCLGFWWPLLPSRLYKPTTKKLLRTDHRSDKREKAKDMSLTLRLDIAPRGLHLGRLCPPLQKIYCTNDLTCRNPFILEQCSPYTKAETRKDGSRSSEDSTLTGGAPCASPTTAATPFDNPSSIYGQHRSRPLVLARSTIGYILLCLLCTLARVQIQEET